MKKIIYSILTVLLIGAMFTSCSEDSLEPTLSIEGDINNVSSISDMQGILNSAYDRLTSTSYYGRDYIIYAEVRSDNCWANGNSGRFLTPAQMAMGDTDGYATGTWAQIYRVIASCNAVINTDPSKISVIDATEQAQLDHIYGQAYALRALAHFDLIKLYGQQHVVGGDATLGIPYIKVFGSDISGFTSDQLYPARNTVAEVETFIKEDLTTALTMMDVTLNDGSKQYMTTYAANALQSRVGIYFGDWTLARDAANAVITSGAYSITAAADLATYFATDGGSSSIFELAYDGTDNNNINGLQQIYRGESYGDIEVLPELATIFDAGDVRGQLPMFGINPDASDPYLRNMGKYPSDLFNDNIALFRYEEVILNYAEALFRINAADANALTYLNMVPAERNATTYAAASEANFLLERRKELCFEGFRFDDLARTGNDIPETDAFLQTHGGPTYGSFNYAFPIPEDELTANKSMVQNFGY